ncbi:MULTISPECIES: phosphopantetheine-binding protein [unclassified Chryseobacterium]|uniref:phosphopantetheine-binding protein n=1 Tax=unclassified Chryseobacterium TaxID=2593645 RepID=UPI001E3C0799|nr:MULTISPECIES: phosphopantetheine-binding protein [unclassified Chryseobacterium]MCD0480720.1 phosphopantetheine-binding protein [Chryseobacterium sp. LC2016-29]MDY0930803.1 phosphopantetheine-binding protein [Chryseobacterium sp. CFBP8996]
METKQKIKEIIIEKLNLKMDIQEFQDNTPLFLHKKDGGLGLDSIDTLEIAVGITDEFNVEFSDSENMTELFTSVESLANYINTALCLELQ